MALGDEIPADVSLKWVEDAKGKPALKVQPTKKEFAVDDDWVVVLTGIEFTDGVIEFDALGQSDPPQSNFLGVAFRFVDETTARCGLLPPVQLPRRRCGAEGPCCPVHLPSEISLV